ncbi:hypothetical protein L1049_018908 [Liquidambar formosana]|uniref:Uncharacterized protein n=1 Tax=Liquidambar formosana TaxID=63359 RepID=A0AAP0RAP6_LIQFO
MYVLVREAAMFEDRWRWWRRVVGEGRVGRNNRRCEGGEMGFGFGAERKGRRLEEGGRCHCRKTKSDPKRKDDTILQPLTDRRRRTLPKESPGFMPRSLNLQIGVGLLTGKISMFFRATKLVGDCCCIGSCPLTEANLSLTGGRGHLSIGGQIV